MLELAPEARIESEFRSINEWVDERAKNQATQIAYYFLDHVPGSQQQLTFAQLKLQVDFVADQLYSRYSVGDRVLLFYPTGIEFIISFLGCLKAGLVAIPVAPPRQLNKEVRNEWVQNVARDSKSTAMLTTSFLAEVLQGKFEDFEIIDPTCDLHGVASSLFLANANSEAWMDYWPSEIGEPQSQIFSHLELLRYSQSICESIGLNCYSTNVSCLQLTSQNGLLAGILSAVSTGCTTVFMSPFDVYRSPLRLLETISSFQADAVGAPELVYQLCSSMELPATEFQLDRLRRCYCETDFVVPEIQRLFEMQFGENGLKPGLFEPLYLKN